jgi:hypothetical protein
MSPIVLVSPESHLQIIIKKFVDLVISLVNLLNLSFITQFVIKFFAVKQAAHNKIVIFCVNLFLHIFCG